MTKLRDDLRTAFEREQTALGNVGDARDRLMHGALAQRDLPASRGLQLAAGVAAALIAAIVIATFVLVRGGSYSQVVPGATPSPRVGVSPTPLGNEISVPEATPLILYYDPARFDQIDGITWAGTDSGRLGPGGASGVTSNPAGTMYATRSDYRNRAGKVIAPMDAGAGSFQGTWADDELHYCQIVPFYSIGPNAVPTGANGVPATLRLNTPGGTPRNVAQIGKVYQQAATYVAACSVQADRAVVVELGGVSQYWVIQLSTGRVLWTRDFGFNASTGRFELVVASRDGQYIAEVHNTRTVKQPTFESTIYGSTGSVVGHVAGAVQAFSWDGSLAVVGAKEAQLSVMRWRDSTVIWSAPRGVWYGGWAQPEPGGTRIAVGAFNPANPFSNRGPEPLDLYIVSADGRPPVVWAQAYPV
jgi:hypothetical protein